MPNWVTNKLEIGQSDTDRDFINTVKEFVYKDSTQIFDFNKVIPLHRDLLRPRLTDKQKQRNLSKYGFESWYEFCTEKWGTKWNACDLEDTDNGFMFNTAWSPPLPVVLKISKYFHNTHFNTRLRLKYIDEGGELVGEVEFVNGTIHNPDISLDSVKGERLRAELRGEALENWIHYDKNEINIVEQIKESLVIKDLETLMKGNMII